MKKASALAAAAVLGLTAVTTSLPAEAGGLIAGSPEYGYCSSGYYNFHYGVSNPLICYSHGVRPDYAYYDGPRFYGPQVYHRHHWRRSIWP